MDYAGNKALEVEQAASSAASTLSTPPQQSKQNGQKFAKAQLSPRGCDESTQPTPAQLSPRHAQAQGTLLAVPLRWSAARGCPRKGSRCCSHTHAGSEPRTERHRLSASRNTHGQLGGFNTAAASHIATELTERRPDSFQLARPGQHRATTSDPPQEKERRAERLRPTLLARAGLKPALEPDQPEIKNSKLKARSERDAESSRAGWLQTEFSLSESTSAIPA